MNILLLDNAVLDIDGFGRVGAPDTRRAVMAATPHPGTDFDSALMFYPILSVLKSMRVAK